jgi:gamma-glutamyltranspeptidase/glutathione hydrolase/leukotriene-C4 hydrolase
MLAKSLNVSYKEMILNKEMSELFINPETNQLYQENDKIRFLKLAQTLRLVAEHGNSDIVYKGDLTHRIVKEINENGGNITEMDFHEYEAKIEENRLVIRLDDNYRIYAPPPPSSAILVAFILKLMRNFSMLKNFHLFEDVEVFYHRLAESFKHAYAKRSHLGDEDFVDLKKILTDLQNDTFIDEILGKINDEKTFSSEFYGQAIRVNNFGTCKYLNVGF